MSVGKIKGGRMARLRWTAAPLAGLAVGLGAAPVVGQTLDPVVISASRAQQRSFDAPAAIETVDRDTLQNAGPQVNLSESLNRVPGLTILNRQNYAQDLQLSIRGFGARAAFGIRGIRLLIDGIPATTPDGQAQGSSVALTSTDRIEVLRGPLALMYGNASGGVIQAFTREAPEVPEFGVQYYTGSYDMRRTDWQYAGRLGEGAGGVGLVADYSTFDTDGFRDNSRTERKQFNGKLSFGPDSGTRVNVVYNYFDMPLAQDPLGLTAAALAQDATQSLATPSARVRKITSQNQAGTSVSNSLGGDRSITGRLYYGTRDNLQYQTNNVWVGLARSYYGAGLQYNDLARLGSVPVRWVAGYEFDRSREWRTGGNAVLGEKSTLNRSEDNQSENSDVFLQGTALVSERWSVIGGLRYSTVRFVSDDYYVTGSNPDGSGNVMYQATSPVLGVTWHASERLNVYANYGKGFETPTLAEVAYVDTGTAVSARFNPNLLAATSRHYETGAKWVPQAGSRVDFAVFLIDTSDEIVVSRSASGQTAYKNAPGTRRTGWELAGSTLFAPQWRGLLAATAIDARYSQSFTNGTTPVADGNKLPGIPHHYVFGELLWASQPLVAGRGAPRLGSSAGVEWVSSGLIHVNDSNYDSAAGTATRAEGYNVFNLKASHGWSVANKGTLTAYARLDNVTDQRYVGSVIVNQASSQFYEPAPGYNWTLGARLNLPL
jgi:iron complex outermembrane receptor protein